MSDLFEKLLECVQILVYNQLKENSDDSYPEKLLDVFNHVKHNLTFNQLKLLLNFLVKSLEESLTNQNISSNISLKLIGLLLDSNSFQTEPCLIDKYISSLSSFANHFNLKNCTNYTVQHSFIICLSALSSSLKGCVWICSSDSILHTIFQLLIQMNGFYVKQEAEKLFYQILKVVLKSNHSQLLSRCDPYLHQILLLNNLSLINCLKSLLKEETIRQNLIDRYQIDTLLLKKLPFIKDDFIISYCECLAISLSSQTEIQGTIKRLKEINQLKGLIAFVSQLIILDSNFVSLWIHYSCLPFLIKSSFNNYPIPVSVLEKEWFETFTTKNEIWFILSKIDSTIISVFNFDHLKILITSLTTFINHNINKIELKKLVFGSIKKLYDITKSLDYSKNENRFNFDQIFVSLTSIISKLENQVRCEILKYLRNIINSVENDILSLSLKIEIINHLNQIISSDNIENELDAIDSSIEVLTALLEKDQLILVKSNSDLINSFFSLWKKSSQDLAYFNLNITCLPLLLNLDLNLSQNELLTFDFKKFYDIPNIIASHLNGDYNCKMSSLKAILIHIQEYALFQCNKVTALSNSNHDLFEIFFQTFAYPLSSLIRTEVDSEILSNTLSLWNQFLTLTLTNSSISFKKLIKNCHQFGLFHSLYFLLQSDYIILKNKKEAIKVINVLKNQMLKLEINQTSLIEIFDKCSPSILISTIKFDECDKKKCCLSREEVIDKIFKDENVLPTQDLISKFIQKPFENLSIFQEMKPIKVSSFQLCSLLLDSNLHQIHDLSNDEKLNDVAILDDILAAKEFTNSFSIDCY